MDPFWQRIRLTTFGLGHVSFGAAVILIAVSEPDQTAWSFTELMFGGLILVRGMSYLGAAQEIREAPPQLANGHAQVGIPLAVGNGHARVGIPLAPAERGDPELEIEGLLLHHDPPRIWVPLGNARVVVHNPFAAANDHGRMEIRLPPVEQGNPELAIGLVLNDPPQALNRRDRVGVEQVEINNALQVEAVEDNGAVLVGNRIAPEGQGDQEREILGLALHEPLLGLDREAEAGVEQVACDDAEQAQAAANDTVRVGIRLKAVGVGDPSLVAEGLLLRQAPPKIQASALNLNEFDVVPLKREQEQEPLREKMLRTVLHDLPLVLDGIDESGAKQCGCSGEWHAEVQMMEEKVLLRETEEPALLVEELALPPKIQASALNLNEFDVDPLKREQEQGPLREEMLRTVLHDLPLVLDRIDESGAKQCGCSGEWHAEVQMMEEKVLLTETEEPALLVEELALLAVERESLVDKQALQPDKQALQPDEHALQPDEQALQPDEQALQPDEQALQPDEQALQPKEPALETEEQALQTDELATLVDYRKDQCVGVHEDGASLRDPSKVGLFFERGQKESMDCVEQIRLLDGTVPKVLLAKPVYLRFLNDAVQEDSLNESLPDALLEATVQANLLKQPLLTAKMEDPVSAGKIDKSAQTKLLDKPMPAQLLDEAVQAEMLDDPVLFERLDELMLDKRQD